MFYVFSFFRQPAFDGLCLSGSLPCIHVNTDVSNFTLRQINLCVCVCVPVWIFLWPRRPLGDEKLFSHWLQEYKYSPVCLLLWTVRLCFVVNRLSQTVQRYCFSPSFVLLRSLKLLLVRMSSDKFPVQVKITDKHWELTMADQVYWYGGSWVDCP